MQSRQSVRSKMRAQRRRLPPQEIAVNSAAICARIRSIGAYRRARVIAIYFGFDGEPLVHELLKSSTARLKHFYAPVIDEHAIRFAAIREAHRLTKNRFGIIEPTTDDYVDPRKLDLVITPLVAFDTHGTRLGVGAGYYDRCFGFLAHRKSWRKPHLLGVAHSFQETTSISAAQWDVPLWGVVTEREFRTFSGD